MKRRKGIWLERLLKTTSTFPWDTTHCFVIRSAANAVTKTAAQTLSAVIL
jgi:hypothetical protein